MTTGCECTGCCGTSFRDFPDNIYVRFYYDDGAVIHIDYCTTMRKILEPVRTACKCVQCYHDIYYASNPMLITENNSWLESGLNTCCFAVVLHGMCPTASEGVISGDCNWRYTASYRDAFNNSIWTPISISCLTEGSLIVHDSDCIIPTINNPLNHPVITFSEEYIGGDSPVECDKLCCIPLPVTLYITLSSNCAALNGVTIELSQDRFGWPHTGGPRSPDTVHNLAGYGSMSWVAYKKLCGCSSLTRFQVYMTTWTKNPLCRWGLRITSNNTTSIVPDLEIEYSNDFCPPIEFTYEGDIDLEGEEDDPDDPYVCCPTLEHLTLVATVTE